MILASKEPEEKLFMKNFLIRLGLDYYFLKTYFCLRASLLAPADDSLIYNKIKREEAWKGNECQREKSQ